MSGMKYLLAILGPLPKILKLFTVPRYSPKTWDGMAPLKTSIPKASTIIFSLTSSFFWYSIVLGTAARQRRSLEPINVLSLVEMMNGHSERWFLNLKKSHEMIFPSNFLIFCCRKIPYKILWYALLSPLTVVLVECSPYWRGSPIKL